MLSKKEIRDVLSRIDDDSECLKLWAEVVGKEEYKEHLEHILKQKFPFIRSNEKELSEYIVIAEKLIDTIKYQSEKYQILIDKMKLKADELEKEGEEWKYA